MRFESVDKIQATVTTWSSADYVVVAVTGADGAEKQVLRRSFLPGEDRAAATSALPRCLRLTAPTGGQLYGMLQGGQRVGRLAVKILPDDERLTQPASTPKPRADIDINHGPNQLRIQGLEFEIAECKDLLQEQYGINSRLFAEVGDWKRRYEALEREVGEALDVLGDDR